jgi:hypothetical protein
MKKTLSLALVASQGLVILLGFCWEKTVHDPNINKPPNIFTYLGGFSILLVFVGCIPWKYDRPDRQTLIKRIVLSGFLAYYLGFPYLTDQFSNFHGESDFIRVGVELTILLLLNTQLIHYGFIAAIGGSLFLFVAVAMTFYNQRHVDLGIGFFSWWKT